MLGYATYQGGQVIVIDIVYGEALVTPGQANLMSWVSVTELKDFKPVRG